MAKTTAPALSFGAGGSIAKTMVYSRWRGINYVRQHVVPANPRTTGQTFVRNMFALLREMWKLAPTDLADPWNAFAQGRPFTGMNKFVGENVRVMNGELDMANFIGSPGAKGGLPPDLVALDAPSATTITATFTVPAAPTGWTLVGAYGVCFKNQAPDGIFEGVIQAQNDLTTPYVLTFTGLVTATEYVVSGWLKWQKPDMSYAYSVGLTGTQTTD